jgi:hypothetical protein
MAGADTRAGLTARAKGGNMAHILRRVLMISAGVAAVTAEFAVPHAAHPIGLIDTPELQRKCLSVGGHPSHDSDGKSRCETEAMDERCDQIIAPQYDKDGNRIHWVYNIRTGQCERDEGCFLTTACTAIAGLSDDCFELSSLRRFRDEVLIDLPGGREDIALYYRVAPAIVERIAASPDRSRALARLYLLYILPSALAAWLGWTRVARWTYTRMMRHLVARYRIVPG